MTFELTPQTLAAMGPALREKVARCREVLRALEGVLVAFSAGVDSTFLLALAAATLPKGRVLAAVGVSPSLPQLERRQARELAESIGVELVEIETDELDDPAYAANPARRCFFCKKALFSLLRERARDRGLPAVVSGANADDRGDFRPGLEAGAELGVRNPLMDAGLTKADVREASRAMGLPTWDKPAMACLASRIPYGQPITAERLSRIERAEQFLREGGFRQCRVRDHDGLARIEVLAEDLPRLLEQGGQVARRLKEIGFAYVTMDLQGFRSGSMNEVLNRQAAEPAKDVS